MQYKFVLLGKLQFVFLLHIAIYCKNLQYQYIANHPCSYHSKSQDTKHQNYTPILHFLLTIRTHISLALFYLQISSKSTKPDHSRQEQTTYYEMSLTPKSVLKPNQSHLLHLPPNLLHIILTHLAYGIRGNDHRFQKSPVNLIPISTTCQALFTATRRFYSDDNKFIRQEPTLPEELPDCEQFITNIYDFVKVPDPAPCRGKLCYESHKLFAFYTRSVGLKRFNLAAAAHQLPSLEFHHVLNKLRHTFTRLSYINADPSCNAYVNPFTIDKVVHGLRYLLPTTASTLEHVCIPIGLPQSAEIVNALCTWPLSSVRCIEFTFHRPGQNEVDRTLEVAGRLLMHIVSCGVQLKVLKLSGYPGYFESLSYLFNLCPDIDELTIEMGGWPEAVARTHGFLCRFPEPEDFLDVALTRLTVHGDIQLSEMDRIARYVLMLQNERGVHPELHLNLLSYVFSRETDGILSLYHTLRNYNGFGYCIRTLNCSTSKSLRIQDILSFCHGLHELDLDISYENIHQVDILLQKMKNLKKLNLRGLDQYILIRPHPGILLAALLRAKFNLEHVQLSHWNLEVSKTIFQAFRSTLKVVKIYGCQALPTLEDALQLLTYVYQLGDLINLQEIHLPIIEPAPSQNTHHNHSLTMSQINLLLSRMQIRYPRFDRSTLFRTSPFLHGVHGRIILQ